VSAERQTSNANAAAKSVVSAVRLRDGSSEPTASRHTYNPEHGLDPRIRTIRTCGQDLAPVLTFDVHCSMPVWGPVFDATSRVVPGADSASQRINAVIAYLREIQE
jgi:hypothetical protein